MKTSQQVSIDTIPLAFALQQIACIDVDKSIQKLEQLMHEVTYRTLTLGRDQPIQVTDSIHVDYHDMLELFVGFDGQSISPVGAELLHLFFDQGFLVYHSPPIEPYPELLVDFERKAKKTRQTVCTDSNDISAFDYPAFENLFSRIGLNNQLPRNTVYIGDTAVTRVTQTANGQYSAYYVWEDDRCRSHYCFPSNASNKRLG